MDISTLHNAKKVHFIGIGGIGMSAIARMLLAEGKKVTGSDLSSSEITEALEKLGTSIFYSQDSKNISDDVDLVMYTVAINENNPELKTARERGIPVLSYPEVLGLISQHKFTIAVSGTHGKTTTTAMIGKVLIDAGLDPTIIVGSLLKDAQGNQTNFVSGKSEYLVVEACEFKRSFLQINPKIIVITNIDDDHLDYYKDMNGVEQGFKDFVAKLPTDGMVVADLSLPHVKNVIQDIPQKVFDSSSISEKIELRIPGEHNRQNAKAALAIASILNIPKEKALESLKNFSGTWRRFEYRGETKSGVTIYDDYAHHPTEIKATLDAAKELFGNKKLTVIFQPHLYSRTKEHLEEFAEVFADVSKVIIAPIYAAREPIDPEISSEILTKRIKTKNSNVHYIETFSKIEAYILENTKHGEIVMTMGAGDIYHVGDALLSQK